MILKAAGIDHLNLDVKNYEDVLQKCTKLDIEVYYGGAIEWEKSSSN